MGGGPASADVVRSSCFVTFPEQTRAEPVPVDAWYLFAAGLTFLRRLARDRVGDEMRIALLLQEPGDEAGERRYVSVSSNAVLQRALQETFDCPDKALVLHVIDVQKVRGQKRIHVRPEVNPNVSPEPVEPMGLVFPTLSVDGLVTPTAVEVPAAQVTSESLYEQMSRSMFNYRKDDSVRWSSGSLEKPKKTLSQSAFFVEERDYTRRGAKKGEEQQEKRRQRAGAPLAVEAVGDLLPAAKQVDDCNNAEQQQVEQEQVGESESDIPVATVVEADATQIPSDYVMLELQTGAGLPAVPANASSTYFISSRWAEQADEMSASMRLERPPMPRATPVHTASRVGSIRANANLEDSFVILERHEL